MVNFNLEGVFAPTSTTLLEAIDRVRALSDEEKIQLIDEQPLQEASEFNAYWTKLTDAVWRNKDICGTLHVDYSGSNPTDHLYVATLTLEIAKKHFESDYSGSVITPQFNP